MGVLLTKEVAYKQDQTLTHEKVMSIVIHVSKIYGGRTHDFKICKSEKSFGRDSTKIVDSGY